MGGLYLQGLIHGGAYFRNFTVFSSSDMAIIFFKLPLYVDLLFREFLPSFNLIPFGTFLQLIK